jgi:hypothetical protein
MENINIWEQRGKELETNCLGSINSKKYKEKLAETMELLKIYTSIIWKEKKEEDPKARIYFDFDNISMNAVKEKVLEKKRNDPEGYEKIKNEIKDKVRKKLNNSMENKHHYLDIPIEEQLKIVEKSQRNENDIFEPQQNFASDLHAHIAEELTPEDYSNLEYYTSVNSHLDWMGIDGFFKFKYKNKKGEEEQVRIPFDICSKNEMIKRQEQSRKRALVSDSLSGDITILDMEGKEDYNRKNEEDQILMKIFTKRIIKEIKKQINEKEGDNKWKN